MIFTHAIIERRRTKPLSTNGWWYIALPDEVSSRRIRRNYRKLRRYGLDPEAARAVIWDCVHVGCHNYSRPQASEGRPA